MSTRKNRFWKFRSVTQPDLSGVSLNRIRYVEVVLSTNLDKNLLIKQRQTKQWLLHAFYWTLKKHCGRTDKMNKTREPKISFKNKQETPQCDKTRFSTLQPSIDMTGIRNERWQWRKNDAIILVASVACTKFGVNRPKQTKVIERKLNFYF